jgi:hypothetical protein
MQKEIDIKSLSEKFDGCNDIGDLFELVKETVKQSLGRRRAGLTLYMSDLPQNLGAFHVVGSNAIVMNRYWLNAAKNHFKIEKEVNAFTYLILLHEYLHSLGFMDEAQVRRLVHSVSKDCFGYDHTITELSKESYHSMLKEPMIANGINSGTEVIQDFDRSNLTYIK